MKFCLSLFVLGVAVGVCLEFIWSYSFGLAFVFCFFEVVLEFFWSFFGVIFEFLLCFTGLLVVAWFLDVVPQSVSRAGFEFWLELFWSLLFVGVSVCVFL